MYPADPSGRNWRYVQITPYTVLRVTPDEEKELLERMEETIQKLEQDSRDQTRLERNFFFAIVGCLIGIFVTLVLKTFLL